jgi:hypothetical protein
MVDFEKSKNNLEKFEFEEPMLVKGLRVGGINNRVIVEMADDIGIKINGATRYCLESIDFKTLPKRQKQDMVKIRLNSLGLKGDCLTYDEINKRATFWGFKECPMETALELLLNEMERFMDNPIFVATQPFYNLDKTPFIFRVDFKDRSIMLINSSKSGGKGWSENDEFMFMVPRGVVGEVRA